jgi:hypothetical protein
MAVHNSNRCRIACLGIREYGIRKLMAEQIEE